jgi:hypothetical protein
MEVLMPLHVDIRINNRLINTLHIGRVSGTTDPDSINEYVIVDGEKPETVSQWYEGTDFTHRYGDGAEICVAKGLEALYGKQDS